MRKFRKHRIPAKIDNFINSTMGNRNVPSDSLYFESARLTTFHTGCRNPEQKKSNEFEHGIDRSQVVSFNTKLLLIGY